jgi:hypothetical protein
MDELLDIMYQVSTLHFTKIKLQLQIFLTAPLSNWRETCRKSPSPFQALIQEEVTEQKKFLSVDVLISPDKVGTRTS